MASALGVAPAGRGQCRSSLRAAVLLLRVSQIRPDAGATPPWRSSPAAPWRVGVLVISLTSGVNTNVSNYMFGSHTHRLARRRRAERRRSARPCSALFTLFYPRIFAVTFDETFARATGTRAQALQHAARRAHGGDRGARHAHDGRAAHIHACIIFPPLSAMRVFRSLPLGDGLLCGAVRVPASSLGMTASYALGDALGRQRRGREHTSPSAPSPLRDACCAGEAAAAPRRRWIVREAASTGNFREILGNNVLDRGT